MSLTKRTWGNSANGRLFTATGSVSGATTRLTLVFQTASWIYGVEGTINVYVDGTKQSCSWTTNSTETVVSTTYKTKMTSAQITVSKPFFTLKLTDSAGGNVLSETTFSFYEIEKAPTGVTASGGVMDGSTNSKVVFATSVTDATYKVVFSLGSKTGTATSTTKTLEYAIPLSWCSELPNKTAGTADVACQVLFGGQVYKTLDTTLNVSVPSSVKPTVSSITISDKPNTPVPSTWNLYIQHKSGVRLSAVTCAGAQGSTIKTIKLQVGDQSVSKTYSASSLPQIDTVTQSGSLTVTVTVTDSRGRTGSRTGTVTFVPYSAPKFKKCVSERCNSAGQTDNDGTFFLSTTSVEYSSCSGKNSITMTMKYKKTDAATYNSPVTLVPGTNVCGGSLNTEFSYDVLYTVSDQFTTVTFVDYVSTAVYLMHFLHGGRGVAFGQKATIEDCVDFDFQGLFRKLVTFLGKAVFKSADKDRVVINDTTKASPVMVDPDGSGTLYAVATSKDIGAAASKAVANNLTTTASGSVLDARQGKKLNDEKVSKSGDSMTGNLTVDKSAVTDISSALITCIGSQGTNQISLLANNHNNSTSGLYDAANSRWVAQYDKNDNTLKIPGLAFSGTADGTAQSALNDFNQKLCRLRRIGNIVWITGYCSSTTSSGATVSSDSGNLWLVPDAYRPAGNRTIPCTLTTTGNVPYVHTVTVSSSGYIKCDSSTARRHMFFSGCYSII